MGLGYGGSYGLAAVKDELLRLVAERKRDAAIKQQLQQQDFENQLRRESAEHQRRYQDAQLASLAEQRDANADLRRQNAAHQLEGDLTIGDPLDATASGTLRAAGRGGNIEQREAHLPSTQYTGFVRTAGAPNPAGGSIRTSLPGDPAGEVYRGNPAQRQARQQQDTVARLIQSLPPGSRERLVLEYEQATGKNAPSIFMPTPPREPTPRYSLHPTFDDEGRQIGAVRFNAVTGDASPAELPGGFLRTPGGARTTTRLPARVQGFLMDLRARHATFNDAFQELQRVLANAPDEASDRLAASTALRSLYAQPTGQGSELDQLLRDGGDLSSGNQFLPEAPPVGRGAPRSGAVSTSGTITRAELRAVAQRLGISEQAAAQQAQARGLQVQ